jgi:hypothetical protein
MEKTERLKQEIQQMNELIERTVKTVAELEEDFKKSADELLKFQHVRKTRN